MSVIVGDLSILNFIFLKPTPVSFEVVRLTLESSGNGRRVTVWTNITFERVWIDERFL